MGVVLSPLRLLCLGSARVSRRGLVGGLFVMIKKVVMVKIVLVLQRNVRNVVRRKRRMNVQPLVVQILLMPLKKVANVIYRILVILENTLMYLQLRLCYG